MALVHNLPHLVEVLSSRRVVLTYSGFVLPSFPRGGGPSSSFLGFRFWLHHFVFADKMLDEIVLAVACVQAIGKIAGPPFEVSMPFVLVSNPVCFSLEGFRLGAFGEGTCEWVNVFVDVFGPVGGLRKLFDLKTDGAFKFCWKSGDRRLRDT